jgi:hypothetical protein
MQHSLPHTIVAQRAQAEKAPIRRPSPRAVLIHERQRERVMASLLTDCRSHRPAVRAHP